MIVSRTPFRVSFVGGGSDIDAYYKNQPGAVVSTTIDKYMYVTVNERFDDSIRVAYTETEIVDAVDDIQHDIVRETMKLVGIEGGVEVTTIADIPAGTGLGSSSSLTVGLLNAFYAYKGEFKDRKELAAQACEIEIDVLNKPIGKQDQYAASFGGLNFIEFYPDETVSVEPIKCKQETKTRLEEDLLLFYTGSRRSADKVLEEQREKTRSGTKNVEKLEEMAGLARRTRERLEADQADKLGNLLHENWRLKKALSEGITSPELDRSYEAARGAGADGGKLLGAGGGGFFLFYCKESCQERVQDRLEAIGLKQNSFKFETEGSKIVYAE